MSFIAQTLSAWNQVLVLIAAAFCLSIGALLLGNRLYWRLGAARAQGAVIGVRETRGNMYYAVYRYTLPDGTGAEANSDVGMSACAALRTGREVRLLVFPNHPDKVMDAGSWLVEMFGAIFAVGGAFLLHFALSTWPVTDMTWVILAAALVLSIRAVLRRVRRRPDGSPPPPMSRQPREDLGAVPVRPIESILASPEQAALLGRKQQNSRFAQPIFALAGLAVLAVAAYAARQTSLLSVQGLRAPGTVEAVEPDRSSTRGSYFPVVRFVAANGASVRFRDRTGSKPPSYHAGDAVTVVYLQDSPSASASIDRGWSNWAPSAALCALGVLFLFASWKSKPAA